MDMLEIIELINGLGKTYHFCVKLVRSVDLIQHEEDNCLFFDKEELIGFLFDKELYGWVVTSYNITDKAYYIPQMSITLYNQDIQRGHTK